MSSIAMKADARKRVPAFMLLINPNALRPYILSWNEREMTSSWCSLESFTKFTA